MKICNGSFYLSCGGLCVSDWEVGGTDGLGLILLCDGRGGGGCWGGGCWSGGGGCCNCGWKFGGGKPLG